MKFLKFKFLVPVLAIVFAITASAFTTIDNSKVDENTATIMGYTENAIPGQPCDTVQVDCSVAGSLLCTYNGKQVYRLKSGTSCFSQLKRNP
jgi:Family of unknown function (DUF6520)